jgi:hypothetical protein
VIEDAEAIVASVRADPAASKALAAFDGDRRSALRFRRGCTATGLILGLACFVLLAALGLSVFGLLLALALAAGALGIGASALSVEREELKVPVLVAAAKSAGFDYREFDFDPPGYPEARDALFPWRTGEEFEDLFLRQDSDGRGLAVFEARIYRGGRRNDRFGFKGRVFWIEREPKATSATIILPHRDRDLFDFGDPCGLPRVRFSLYPDFDSSLEIYSDDEGNARVLFSDPLLRSLLLDLRAGGKVYAFFGRYNAVVAVDGLNWFEPGSPTDWSPAEDRVRAMAGDLCDSLAILRKLKERVG